MAEWKMPLNQSSFTTMPEKEGQCRALEMLSDGTLR